MLYEILLALHSWVRWPVLILAIIFLVRVYWGWLGNKAWTTADGRTERIYSSLFDLQILLGLILYFFVSPITTGALRNFGAAMGNPGVRFFAIEHALLMILASVAAHMGGTNVKKEPNDRSKFKKAALWYTLALVLLLVAIPWPFLAAGRPLFRLGF